MALFYSLGKLIFCLALTFQGLYILGVIPGQSNVALINSMRKGLTNFQSHFGVSNPAFKEVDKHLPEISMAIGGLIALAGLNILISSRLIAKLNILGVLLLTFFVGIPYNVLKDHTKILDPADKTLFHFYANIALLGGLLYFHSTIQSQPTIPVPPQKKTQ